MSSALPRDVMMLVRTGLESHGFSAKGSTFRRKTNDGNVLLIAIQRSSTSTADVALVTLNYGVYSARLGALLEDEPSAATRVESAHWRGRLQEAAREKWMRFDAGDSVDATAQTILVAAESLVPTLLAHASDSALLDEWLAGSSPGQTNMARLLFAAILLHDRGAKTQLASVLSELHQLVDGKDQQRPIAHQLARAGVTGW